MSEHGDRIEPAPFPFTFIGEHDGLPVIDISGGAGEGVLELSDDQRYYTFAQPLASEEGRSAIDAVDRTLLDYLDQRIPPPLVIPRESITGTES